MVDILTQGFAKYPEATDQTVVNEIFKLFYLPAVRDQLNNKRILSRYLRRNREDVAGEEARIAIRIGRNEGQGFIGERGYLPEPGKQQYRQIAYRMRYDYGRILFTGPAVASSRNKRGAFIQILDGEIRGLAQDMQYENNRVCHGDGSGVLAVVEAVDSGSLTVHFPGGFSNPGPGTQYLRPGMRVSVVLSTGPTFRVIDTNLHAARIIEVNYDSQTIVLAKKDGTAADHSNAVIGDVIVRASQEDENTMTVELDTSFKNEPWGIAGLVDEGANSQSETPGGINSDIDAIWNAPVVDNAGVSIPFHQDMLQRGMDAADIQGDSNVQMWMTSHGIRRTYVANLVEQKRFVGTETLDGGFRAVLYDGIPMVVDKDVIRGRVYGLNLKHMMIFAETDFAWMDADGSILHRVPNYDAYQATLYRYWEMGTDKRNSSVVIKDIEDV